MSEETHSAIRLYAPNVTKQQAFSTSAYPPNFWNDKGPFNGVAMRDDAQTPSAPELLAPKPEQRNVPNVEVLLKTALILRVITTCVVPSIDKTNPADQHYFADAMYVAASMSNGLTDEQIKSKTEVINEYIAKLGGDAVFCKENKPRLDELVAFARQQYPKDLESNFRKWMGRGGCNEARYRTAAVLTVIATAAHAPPTPTCVEWVTSPIRPGHYP